MKKEKFYIATSIVYTNNIPHIGFALEIIQADVIARYQAELGKEVLFSTGTDEHGTKIARTAEKTGQSPKEFTEEIAQKVKKLTKTLNLSNHDFIRTTDKKRHWPVVKNVWLKLKKNKDIYKKKYRGLYCVGCEAFLKKGEFINGNCPIHKIKPEIIEEENYFFRLSKYQSRLKKEISSGRVKIIPERRKKELLSFLNQKLEDVSCSRPKEKLSWGIPIPDDKEQTVYVWLEALINYLSVAGYSINNQKFNKFWPTDVHCIGKDIFVRFHGSLWLAILLSLKLKLPKSIFIHGFINVEGQKMSKSLGNIIDPFELIEKYGTDPVRYFLLREISPTEDGDFSYQKFEKRYNSDLASGLGNLLARVATMAKNLENKKLKQKSLIADKKLAKEIVLIEKKYKIAINQFKFNESLSLIWQIINLSDKYIDKEKPWQKSEQQKEVINNLVLAINKIAELLKPFLPETSEKIIDRLKTKKNLVLFPRINRH